MSTVAIKAATSDDRSRLLLLACVVSPGLRRGVGRRRAAATRTRRRPESWYGMFPSSGADRSFFRRRLSRALALADDDQFFSYGWRIPFLASAVLVLVGLYVRLTITETPVFQDAVNRSARVKVPMFAVFRHYPKTLVLGIMSSLATFVLFYLMTVFALAWGTTALGYSREQFLLMQLFGIVFFALTIPFSAILAERGRRSTLIGVTIGIGFFGFVMAPMLESGTFGAMFTMALGLALMGT
jgi:MFS family permease